MLKSNNMDIEHLTRRDFIRYTLLGLGGLGITACTRNILQSTETASPSPQSTETPFPKPTEKPIPSTTPIEKLNTLEPTPGWEISTIDNRMKKLADPNFFTQPQGPSQRVILTPQFDNSQYARLDPQYLANFDGAGYLGNSCGEAVIAETLKTFTYFKTGDIPDITIADVINYLMKNQYQNYHPIWPNNISMSTDSLKIAFNMMSSLGDNTNLYTIEQISDNPAWSETSIIPQSKWPELFHRNHDEVLNKGGMWTAFVGRYSEGHFYLFSSVNQGNQPLIIDSVGPWKKHKKIGDVRYLSIADDVNYYQGIPGFFSLFAMIPTF